MVKGTLPRGIAAFLAALGLHAGEASALTFEIPWGDDSISIVSNSSLTAGAAVRLESQASDLLGKGSINPDLCGRVDGKLYWSGCQGVFREQTFMAERLAQAPGAATSNTDQGNLNYDKGDLTQAPLKLTQDLTLSFGDFGLFVRGLYFHDLVNKDFTEYHPNQINRQNLDEVGTVSRPGTELLRTLGPLTPAIPTVVVRNDSRPCPAERNPGGGPCGLVYSRGGVVHSPRSDKETLREIGEGFQLLEANLYGTVPLPWEEKNLSFKIGRQLVNWGESTVMYFDSLNVINPANANNLFRVGGTLDEVFEPLNMVTLATELFEGASLSGFYQLEWQPLETPAPGSFYSFANIGTRDAGAQHINLGFGQGPDDPENLALLLDNPLSGVTNTSGSIRRLRDREPSTWGQFGLQLRYYADWLNDGTEIGLYYAQYHARVPMISLISAPATCSRNTTSTLDYLRDCPDVPLLHALLGLQFNDPEGATDDSTNFDQSQAFFEYPEDIRMLGLSFNTTLGAIALQGEMVYRPDEPLQVAVVDLGFASYGALGNCHKPDAGCTGTGNGDLTGLLPEQLAQLLAAAGVRTGLGIQPDGTPGTYGSSDFVIDADGTLGAYRDTYDLIIGHLPGAGRLFPSFIVPYRGYELGDNPAGSYIRGWENFDTFQFDLGATYISSATDLACKLMGCDQVISLFEVGARWVPDLPPLDVLQLEGPGIFYHASAGADGSGADRSRQACSTNPACSYGPDGLRFNPHQQDRDLYPTEWSGGYAMVHQVRYESILPAISLAPTIIWKHDIYGHSPGLASNFVEGRRILDASVEVRYKSQWSFNLGYQMFGGGGQANQLRDRDNARISVRYQI
ncbi:DUF1302 family protein [Solimonas sp. K1W22B-7]|uniref:DUF1302 domain-containing protein n=1 Tax=Solimonas sp. K1W22B-7 TaxID=2303331 RepID=UPI000E3302C9|nr:DUF1302 family protein [Solimonas sp. K1W22B-7]AXQ31153.1 DUF1302 family protein [Solimonas sp. K1W22B-7]